MNGGSEKEATLKQASRRFQCDECGRLLSTTTSLERHMLTHTGERPYPCPHCPISFTTNGNLIRHVKSCHESAGAGDSSFSPLSMATLETSNSRLNFLPESNLESPFVAKIPQYSGSVSGSVDDLDADERADSHGGSDLDEKDDTKYKPFLCTLCDKVSGR